ncbi:hypothetical protein EXQ37_03700 [Clostridium botulinum]|nr:antA/AntB antirepressor family protein [Clostridium botulinum]MBO0558949.1 hypothetical protein [Clostridium botulinum]
MNELIKITTNEEGSQIVSARELHEFLQVGSRFNDWISNRINKYDFQEDIDYTKILVQCNRGQNEYDYAITTDMAKELSMVENNKKGKQAREYFINIEKNYKKELLRIQENAYKKIGQLEMEVQALKDKLLKPVLIAKREINVITLFNYINEISGDGLLFNEMYYKIDKAKGTLLIDIRKTYKVLRENYKDVEMFKTQPIAIEKAIEKQDFCYGAYFITNLLNDKYEMKPIHVAIIDIKKLEDAGGCIDNLH